MRNPIETSRHSLPMRLSVWIVSFAALIFLAALGYMFFVSRNAVRREAVKGALQVIDNTVDEVTSILDAVEIAADNTDWLIYRRLDDPEIMWSFSRNILMNNPVLNGCSISFEPYFYKDKGLYYSVFSHRNGDTIDTVLEGSEKYQYFYMDWYQLPHLLNQPCWTEPFLDSDSEIGDSDMIMSYCKPLTADDGSFCGVLSLDLSLSWLSERISELKLYPNSYAMMIGRGGTYLVHPDEDKLFYQTIFTETLVNPNEEISELGHAMLRGETGERLINIDGVPNYVFFQPVKATNWSVAIVCPEKDIFGSYNRLRRIVFLIVLGGLILMLGACAWVVGRELAPLKRLVKQTKSIAAGRFDEPLPEADRVDEIGQLTNSFRDMQTSLVSYIDELEQTTAARERIEGELRIARDIQMGMVPRIFPPFPQRKDVDLYAWMKPAKEVGGDLYDFFIQKEKLYFCVGDVSGKGIPASLFMAVARNLFRVVAQQELPPEQIARQINETISEDNEQMMFITMFIGVADLQTGRTTYCNCGHNPPVLIADRQARFMDVKANAPLGVATGLDFVGGELEDIREQRLFLYTDGLNEAENLAHEQFGNERLLEVLQGNCQEQAEDLVYRLAEAVSDFAGEAEQSDDITLLCLHLNRV